MGYRKHLKAAIRDIWPQDGIGLKKNKYYRLTGKMVSYVGKMVFYWAKPRLATAIHYGKTELTPPTPAELAQVPGIIGKFFSRFPANIKNDCTLRDAFIHTAVAVEVGLWFFIGEVIGKRGVRGYQVHPARDIQQATVQHAMVNAHHLFFVETLKFYKGVEQTGYVDMPHDHKVWPTNEVKS